MYGQSFLLVSLFQYAFMEFIDFIVILYHASVEPSRMSTNSMLFRRNEGDLL